MIEFNDLFLCAGSKSAMHAAMNAAGLMATDEETGKLVIATDWQTSVSVIGTIYEQTGTETVDGEEVPVMTAKPGYHVNVRTRDPAVADALQGCCVLPTSPVRIWA